MKLPVRETVLSTLLSLLTSGLICGRAAGDEVAKPETVAKYQAIFKALEATYGTSTGSVVFDLEGLKDGRLNGRHAKYTSSFMQRPGMLRLDRLAEESTSPEGRRDMAGKGSLIATREKTFSVHKNDDAGSYLLSKLEPPSDRGMRRIRQQYFYCLEAPYSAPDVRYAEKIGLPDWTLFEPTEIVKEGRKLIRLGIGRGRLGKGIDQVKAGSESYYAAVLLDPEIGYAMRGFSNIATGKPVTFNPVYASATMEYEKQPNGPAIPTRYTYQRIWEKPDGQPYTLADGTKVVGHLHEDGQVVFTSYKFVETPASEFDLPAFGLPDIPVPPASAVAVATKDGSPTAKVNNSTPAPAPASAPPTAVPSRREFDSRWLFVLAGFSFVSAIGFKVYSARRSHATPSTPLSPGS